MLNQVFKVSSGICQQFVEDAVKISNVFGFLTFTSRLEKTTRSSPQSRITWLSTAQQDLKQHHLTLPETADLAQNCPLQRMMSTYGVKQS